MSLLFSVRGCARGLVVVTSCLFAASLQAGSPLSSQAKSGFESVELFEAIDRGEVAATVHVRDAEQLNLAIENKTDRNLAIRMPDAFAAVPVHAQFQPALGQGLFNQGNGAQNQGVGGPGGFNRGFNGNNQNQMFNNPGFFNVPPGKVVRVKRPCVCLEHGKDEPNVRLDYELRPINSVIEDRQISMLLQMLVTGGDQRVIQLAVWHRANGVSWDDLASLKIQRVRQPDSPQYSLAELEAATDLLEQVAKLSKQKPTRSVGELSTTR